MLVYLVGDRWYAWLGYVLILIALNRPLSSEFRERQVSAHRIKLKELEFELTKIRHQLFGEWADWKLDLSAVDQGIANGLGKDAIFFWKNSAGEKTDRFTLTISSTTYRCAEGLERLREQPPPWQTWLKVTGHLTGDGSDIDPVFRKPFVLIGLHFSSGTSKTEEVKTFLIRSPEVDFPKSWPKLLLLAKKPSDKTSGSA